MRIGNMALGLLFLAVFLAGGSLLVAHAQSVTLNAGESYNVTFVNVDLSANNTVSYNLYYVDAKNETKPFLSLSGVSFSYNATEPLILSVRNTGSSAVNVTINKLEAELSTSSGSYQVTPSDQAVKIPVAVKAGSKISVTVTPNGDPYPRLIAIALGYSDGTYKLVVSGDEQRVINDNDWPSGLAAQCDTVYGAETYTITADKDVSSIIVYISTYVGHWDVSVSLDSSTGTTSTQQSQPAGNGGYSLDLDQPVDVFGHRTSIGVLAIMLLVLLFAAAFVLLRR